jgi:hypothetical protein
MCWKFGTAVMRVKMPGKTHGTEREEDKKGTKRKAG